MASTLEKQVREMDDETRPVKEVAADIAKKLGVNSGTVEMYLGPKRWGYGQLRDYNECRNLVNDSSYGGIGTRNQEGDSQRFFEGDIAILPLREIRRITDRSSYDLRDLSEEESAESIREHLDDKRLALTELQKEVLQRVIFGETHSEIAKERKVTRAAVGSAFDRAKQKLEEANELGLAS